MDFWDVGRVEMGADREGRRSGSSKIVSLSSGAGDLPSRENCAA